MDLTYLDFTILVGCVSLPLEAIIRAHLLQSFLFLLEQCLWSVAGLFSYFFSSLFPEEGSIVSQTPLTQNSELWPRIWGLQVQRYWSCGSCHSELRVIITVRNQKSFWLLTCVFKSCARKQAEIVFRSFGKKQQTTKNSSWDPYLT